MVGGAAGLQMSVNQGARAVTVCFQTTSLGTMAVEAGLTPAAQLENRQRRFSTWLLSLPQGSEAWKLVGARQRLERGCRRRKGAQAGRKRSPYHQSQRIRMRLGRTGGGGEEAERESGTNRYKLGNG